jgi:putative transcriptional regulator
MKSTVQAGDLLIAPPSMPDPRFNKSVLMLTHYNSQGAYALCLNRKTDYTLNEIVRPLGLEFIDDQPLYWGGPVSLSTVWMLHDRDWSVSNTMQINRDWNITSHEEMFHHLNKGHWPQRFRIMIGHSTWDAGQLDAELEGHEPWTHKASWLTVKHPDPNWLIDLSADQLWPSSCTISGHQAVDSWMA